MENFGMYGNRQLNDWLGVDAGPFLEGLFEFEKARIKAKRDFLRTRGKGKRIGGASSGGCRLE
jgi:hypothetical protein